MKVPEQIAIAWVPQAPESETSAAAASSVRKRGTARRDRDRILRYLWVGAATDEMIGDRLDLPGNTVRPRRGELVKRGWVTDSRMRAPTRSGSRAVMWCITPAGKDALLKLERDR